MGRYDVNFKRLALLLLPTFWRKPLFSAFVHALTSPIGYINTLFSKFRRTSDYRLNHNGQVCYLRAVLNDAFDPIERRIGIRDIVESRGNNTLYQHIEGRTLSLPLRETGRSVILNRRGYEGVNKFDFEITIPTFIEVNENRLRALVNMYKLATKRYVITYTSYM